MILLTIFALIAGTATALSPCALPVLPAVFSAGLTGGRFRPAGIATGLAVSFTFAVVLLVYVISLFGLPDGAIRALAITVLLLFGFSMLVPAIAARIETKLSAFLSPFARRLATRNEIAGRVDQTRRINRRVRREGFGSGFILGMGLGLLYAPCAGPILAGVITATASQSLSGQRLTVAFAYGVGSALAFYALMLGGRRLIAPLIRRSQHLQIGMGALMVIVALAMSADLDTRFQTAIAEHLPAAVVNPTGSLERSRAVADDLAKTRSSKNGVTGGLAGGRAPVMPDPRPGAKLPVIAPAPEFTGNQRWFNTVAGRPITLKQLRGKVVLIDFWTYTCINCIRTLPYLRAWHRTYTDDGLVIVGVHTPEFVFERSAENVSDAIKQNKLRYAVVQDNKYGTWNAYGNQYWPAKYLIDANGNVRYTHFGEGDYEETEDAIRSLLKEAGKSDFDDMVAGDIGAESASGAQLTPEIYLGVSRADRFGDRPPRAGVHDYGARPRSLVNNEVRLSGRWRLSGESATAAGIGARLDIKFTAKRVFLVLGSPGRERAMTLLLDGEPIAEVDAGTDVGDGLAHIGRQRLYRLVDLDGVETHTLTLLPTVGVTGYAFTFG